MMLDTTKAGLKLEGALPEAVVQQIQRARLADLPALRAIETTPSIRSGPRRRFHQRGPTAALVAHLGAVLALVYTS